MNKHFLQFITMLLIFGCSSQDKTESNSQANEGTWWKEGVLYQIYPQSFKDSDGDGFGDFKGILEKLVYVASVGVSMVWMNPFFESPLADNGYDVSDYRAIHPSVRNHGRLSTDVRWFP